MTYSYNPTGHWTASHQMTLNGKRDGFVLRISRCSKKRPDEEAVPRQWLASHGVISLARIC
jgi:hypothetical protein